MEAATSIIKESNFWEYGHLKMIEKNNKSENKIMQPEILILDANNNLFLKHLSGSYTIHKVSSSDECCLYSQLTCFNVILLCYDKASIENADLCKKIKETSKNRYVPVVILLTQSSNMLSKVRFFKAGADEVLLLPEESILLSYRIKKLIELKRSIENNTYRLSDSNLMHESIQLKEDNFAKKAYEFVKKNISDPGLSSSKLCSNLNVSRSTLFRKFKSISGSSPNEAIRQIRLKIAAEILQEKKIRISELAYSLGFSCPSYFTKVFREKFHVAPTKYGCQQK